MLRDRGRLTRFTATLCRLSVSRLSYGRQFAASLFDVKVSKVYQIVTAVESTVLPAV